MVGVFWTRLGTPTGVSPSGTVEEIEKHVAAGKPAMIYFSSQPVAPESIDADQYAQVKAIRENWKSEGLIETYENISDFRQKFSKQLPLCSAKNAYLQGLIVSKSDKEAPNELGTVTKKPVFNLSEEAKTLLKAAAARDDGTILKIASFGGRTIQAGGESFGGQSGREAAKWENALNELEINGLVIARGYKGEVYELTHEGWVVADAL